MQFQPILRSRHWEITNLATDECLISIAYVKSSRCIQLFYNKITHSSQGAQADADAAILMLMLVLDADGEADVNADADVDAGIGC